MATKKQNDEQASPAAPVEENQAVGTENSGQEGAHGEAKASEVREAPADTQENVAAATEEPGPALESLSVLADRHRVPSWQQAALLRFMDWTDDRLVSDAAYRAALNELKYRRIGGGRR